VVRQTGQILRAKRSQGIERHAAKQEDPWRRENVGWFGGSQHQDICVSNSLAARRSHVSNPSVNQP
jgi:hypothetical protein